MTWQSLSRLAQLPSAWLTAFCSFAALSANPGRPAAPIATAFHPSDAAASWRATSSRASAAIEELPVPFRDVYILADVEGLQNSEIADMLGLSVPAVKSRLHRARMRMRDSLAPHFEGGIAS